MGSSDIHVGALSLRGDALQIFDEQGWTRGGKWHFILPPFRILVHEDPHHVSPLIEKILNEDIADDNDKRIAYIRVNPRTALRLFLEGKLTRKHIETAHTTDGLVIIFQEVEFQTLEGLKKFIIVVTQTKTAISTCDTHGQVI